MNFTNCFYVFLCLFCALVTKASSKNLEKFPPPSVSIDPKSVKNIKVTKSSEKFDLLCSHNFEISFSESYEISIVSSDSYESSIKIEGDQDCNLIPGPVDPTGVQLYNGTCDIKATTSFDEIWRKSPRHNGNNKFFYKCEAIVFNNYGHASDKQYGIITRTANVVRVDSESLRTIYVQNPSETFDLPCTYIYENLVTVSKIVVKESNSSTDSLDISLVNKDCQEKNFKGICEIKATTTFDGIWKEQALKGKKHLVYECLAEGDLQNKSGSDSACCGYLHLGNSATGFSVPFSFVMLLILTIVKQFLN